MEPRHRDSHAMKNPHNHGKGPGTTHWVSMSCEACIKRDAFAEGVRAAIAEMRKMPPSSAMPNWFADRLEAALEEQDDGNEK